MPGIADNALLKAAALMEKLGAYRPEPRLESEVAGLLEAVAGRVPERPEDALPLARSLSPLVGELVEPLLGPTFSPTMIKASEKVNVIPARAELKVDCRVPPELGEEHARKRVRELLGEDRYELRFDETVIGNRSPIDTPLMGAIREFVESEDPGAEVAPVMLPGFSDSRWFRDAFPDCIAYGFFPQNEMDLFEAAPLVHGADERVPVKDLGLAARCYARLAQEVLG
jgi:acetylornithine deacetylase/succinyl-diaminopimelate desuccinylase-like protein